MKIGPFSIHPSNLDDYTLNRLEEVIVEERCRREHEYIQDVEKALHEFLTRTEERE